MTESRPVTLIPAPINGGFAYGNNLGIERAYQSAVPDYVYLLNPDTELSTGVMSTLVRFLEARPQVGIAGSSFEYVGKAFGRFHFDSRH